MNKSELIAEIADVCGESRKVVESVLKTTADVIASVLQSGGDAALPGLGKLQTKDKPERTGRNPATGATIQIPAKRVPHFTAAKALKDAVTK